MDLKDVIASVCEKAKEAHDAFHAGHHDTARGFLDRIGSEVATYLYKPATPADGVTESATTVKDPETLAEKPAQAPGAVLPATQFLSEHAAQKKAHDQAGP